MIAVFLNQNMRQQRRASKTVLDGARWPGSSKNSLAMVAGKLRPHMADHL